MPLSSNTASNEEGEGGGDRMEGALLGAKALMLATTLVVGFTGLGMWAVGKAVGAEDVRSFLCFLGEVGRLLELTHPFHLSCAIPIM